MCFVNIESHNSKYNTVLVQCSTKLSYCKYCHLKLYIRNIDDHKPVEWSSNNNLKKYIGTNYLSFSNSHKILPKHQLFLHSPLRWSLNEHKIQAKKRNRSTSTNRITVSSPGSNDSTFARAFQTGRAHESRKTTATGGDDCDPRAGSSQDGPDSSPEMHENQSQMPFHSFAAPNAWQNSRGSIPLYVWIN